VPILPGMGFEVIFVKVEFRCADCMEMIVSIFVFFGETDLHKNRAVELFDNGGAKERFISGLIVCKCNEIHGVDRTRLAESTGIGSNEVTHVEHVLELECLELGCVIGTIVSMVVGVVGACFFKKVAVLSYKVLVSVESERGHIVVCQDYFFRFSMILS